MHKALGPGLLESVYETCLCHELHECGMAFEKQVPLPVRYKAVNLETGYRLDLVVEKQLIVEIKAVDKLLALHEAQLPTYLRLSGLRTGLLLNFNALKLIDGIKRMVL